MKNSWCIEFTVSSCKERTAASATVFNQSFLITNNQEELSCSIKKVATSTDRHWEEKRITRECITYIRSVLKKIKASKSKIEHFSIVFGQRNYLLLAPPNVLPHSVKHISPVSEEEEYFFFTLMHELRSITVDDYELAWKQIFPS